MLLFKLEPTPSANTTFGYSLFVVFHIVRVIIFHCHWMHRNDMRFHELLANIYDVQAQVLAVVNLHTEWFSRDLLDRSVSHSSFTLRQLYTLIVPDPDTVTVAPG